MDDDSVHLIKSQLREADLDRDGMLDEILKLARQKNWSSELIQTCVDALSVDINNG